MAAGQLVAEGSPGEIKSRQTGHLLEFTVDQPQRAANILKTDRERWRVSLFGTRLHVITDDADLEMAKRGITRQLEQQGVHVIDAREAAFSLQAVFIAVVEQARAQESPAVRS